MQNADNQPRGTFKRMPVLSTEELAFYNVLSEAIDDNHAIFMKIPLENIVHPSKHTDQTFLASQTLDFVICDKKTSLPIGVIDIDFPDHPTPTTFFLNTSGIPIIRLNDGITPAELKQRIASAKPIVNIPFPETIDDVAVTIVSPPTREQQQPKPARRPLPKIKVPRYRKLRHKIENVVFWILAAALGIIFFGAVAIVFLRHRF